MGCKFQAASFLLPSVQFFFPIQALFAGTQSPWVYEALPFAQPGFFFFSLTLVAFFSLFFFRCSRCFCFSEVFSGFCRAPTLDSFPRAGSRAALSVFFCSLCPIFSTVPAGVSYCMCSTMGTHPAPTPSLQLSIFYPLYVFVSPRLRKAFMTEGLLIFFGHCPGICGPTVSNGSSG